MTFAPHPSPLVGLKGYDLDEDEGSSNPPSTLKHENQERDLTTGSSADLLTGQRLSPRLLSLALVSHSLPLNRVVRFFVVRACVCFKRGAWHAGAGDASEGGKGS